VSQVSSLSDSNQPASDQPQPADGPKLVLKNPGLAAFLAWLLPGLGHMYQGRWAKGVLFFVCIMGTFAYGIALGSSRVVYASMRQYDTRYYYYICQAGVGLPAMPALVQAWHIRGGNAPWWDGFMAPPVLIGQAVPADWAREQMAIGPEAGYFADGDFKALYNVPPDKLIYAPQGIPEESKIEFMQNELSVWHAKYSFKYDLGTTFTMVAGLLNLLVIFDAYAGPMLGMNLAGWEVERKRREALAERERAEKKRKKSETTTATVSA
jgi:TM2 domain-containing membrane protein YozV